MSPPASFLRRPRVLVQLAVALTVSLTLWITLQTDNDEARLFRPTLVLLDALERRPRSRPSSQSWRLTQPENELRSCEKIFLYSFVPWWGFASEFILYIRAKSMADKLGYTFLADDRAWNYGRLSNYFKPLDISCVPPVDWDDHRKAYPIHQGQRWRFDKKGKARTRLRYSRQLLSNLDDWTRDEYFPDDDKAIQAELTSLKRSDERHRDDHDRWILEPGQTLPRVFETVFRDHAQAVDDTWRIEDDLQTQVDELSVLAGVREPRWLEGRRDGRGPVIGVHIRLGDKATEFDHDAREMGITNRFGNLTTYLEAAHDAYDRLVSSERPQRLEGPRITTTTTRGFSRQAQPTLLVMTAEPGVAQQLAKLPLARPFRIVQTPPPPPPLVDSSSSSEISSDRQKTTTRMTRELEHYRPKAYAGGFDSSASVSQDDDDDGKEEQTSSRSTGGGIRDGYTQSKFNSMPLAERVEHTRTFVRDLALLTSSEVDALVVSGASNIGRLAMLIGGLEAVTAGRATGDESLRIGGKIRSIDAHFYPTSYPSSVYTRYSDVEDLENAAVLPQDQAHHHPHRGR